MDRHMMIWNDPDAKRCWEEHGGNVMPIQNPFEQKRVSLPSQQTLSESQGVYGARPTVSIKHKGHRNYISINTSTVYLHTRQGYLYIYLNDDSGYALNVKEAVYIEEGRAGYNFRTMQAGRPRIAIKFNFGYIAITSNSSQRHDEWIKLLMQMHHEPAVEKYKEPSPPPMRTPAPAPDRNSYYGMYGSGVTYARPTPDQARSSLYCVQEMREARGMEEEDDEEALLPPPPPLYEGRRFGLEADPRFNPAARFSRREMRSRLDDRPRYNRTPPQKQSSKWNTNG